MHLCGVCWTDSLTHPEECYEPGCEDWAHWPPLCCRGCLCGSFEEAHGLVLEEVG